MQVFMYFTGPFVKTNILTISCSWQSSYVCIYLNEEVKKKKKEEENVSINWWKY